MQFVTQLFNQYLKQDHTAICRVDVARGGLESTFSVSGGEVTVDLDQPTRRSLSLQIEDTENHTIEDMERLLDPFISVITPYRGIRFPDGTEEMIELGKFYITELALGETSGQPIFDVTGYDGSIRCESRLPTPLAIPSGQTFESVCQQLLLPKLPSLVLNLAPTPWRTPALLYQEDIVPWTECRKLQTSVGNDFYIERNGEATSAPRITTARAVSVWNFEEGTNADFLDPKRRVSTDMLPNVVVVVGTNSAKPGIRGLAWDNDPASKTYRYGPYGEQVRAFPSELITDSGQAQAMANSLLGRLLGPQDDISFQAIPNPALDVGDTVTVTRAKLGLDHVPLIVSKIELPLAATELMTVTARRSILTDGEGTVPVLGDPVLPPL